jgi:hypothetical protein
MILSARNLKILIRDRSSLILMLVAPPLVGMLDFIIAPLMGRAPFDYMTGDAANGAITLFLLTVYCLLVAGLSQMREFVKEAEIYKRERLVNLKILPYVFSKVWVALLLAFYQAGLYGYSFRRSTMPVGTTEIGCSCHHRFGGYGWHGGRSVGLCYFPGCQLSPDDHDPADCAPDRAQRRFSPGAHHDQLDRLHALGLRGLYRNYRHWLGCSRRSLLEAGQGFA